MFQRYSRLDNGKLRKYNLCFVGSGQDEQTFGSGKTVFLTAAAFDNWKKYKIVYANYHLDPDVIQNFCYIHPDDISAKTVLGLMDNSLLLIQEALYYMDKRNHSSKFANDLYKVLCQIRKKPIDVLCDIPKLSYLEFRYIQSASQFWSADGNPWYKHPIYDPFFQYREMKKKQRFGTNFYFIERSRYLRNMHMYYDMYDTNENSIVERVTEKDKKIKDVQGLTQWV